MVSISENEVPALVKRVLEDAVNRNASDVYWIPRRSSVAIRFRIEGIQVDYDTLETNVGIQCVTHIKVLAALLTYRTQIAQDGSIRFATEDGSVDLRIATMPTLFGERVTIRVLANRQNALYLEDLMFSESCLAALRRILAAPTGLIVLTGPTGSGKTTTIYAMIRELLRNNDDPASIISLEDPIESIVDGISQVSLAEANTSDEWNYEIALKAALRQDVKTLVVGEMRDRAVVKTVLDAALTGHRVITTYHAGDIPSVYVRLLHQGFEPFLVGAAVTGVLSQRLVTATNGTRIPVAAILEPDDAWRDAITGHPNLAHLRSVAKEYSNASLEHAAARLCEEGKLAREISELVTA